VQFPASIFGLDRGERVPTWLNKLRMKLDGLRYAFCNDTGAPKIQAAKQRTTKRSTHVQGMGVERMRRTGILEKCAG
jgi:hypothetical protein